MASRSRYIQTEIEEYLAGCSVIVRILFALIFFCTSSDLALRFLCSFLPPPPGLPQACSDDSPCNACPHILNFCRGKYGVNMFWYSFASSFMQQGKTEVTTQPTIFLYSQFGVRGHFLQVISLRVSSIMTSLSSLPFLSVLCVCVCVCACVCVCMCVCMCVYMCVRACMHHSVWHTYNGGSDWFNLQ